MAFPVRILKALLPALLPIVGFAQGFPQKLPDGVETHAGGMVLGSSDIQTITNKTFDCDLNECLNFAAAFGNVPGYSLFGNGTGTAGIAGFMTTLPASLQAIYGGDCNNSIGANPAVFTCQQASGDFIVMQTLSMNTLNPPTNTFTPPEVDFGNVGLSGIVQISGVSGTVATGSYTSIAASGGSGSGAICTVTAVANVATGILCPTPGTGYQLQDILSFNTGSGTALGTVIGLNNPVTRWLAQNAPTNYGAWAAGASAIGGLSPSRSFVFGPTSDAGGSIRPALTFYGTGLYTGAFVLTSLTFGNATDNPAWIFLGNGPAEFGGAGVFNGSITPGAGGYVHGITIPPGCQQYPASNSGSVTTEVNLGFCEIQPGSTGALSVIRIEITWNNSATAQAKQAIVRFGGTAPTPGSAWSSGATYMTQPMTVSDQTAQSLTIIRAANATNAQFGAGLGFTPYTAGTNTNTNSSQNMANAQYVIIDCIDAASNGSSEFCGIAGFTVEVLTP